MLAISIEFKSDSHEIKFRTLMEGILCEGKTELFKVLRKKIVDVCCMQEPKWKSQGAHFVGTLGRRYEIWCSGNDVESGGVGILVKEEISRNVVEVKEKGHTVMANLLTLGNKVI